MTEARTCVAELALLVGELQQEVERFTANCQRVQAMQADMLRIATAWTVLLAPDLAATLRSSNLADDAELSSIVSDRVQRLLAERENGPNRLDALFTSEAYYRRSAAQVDSTVADFMFGNPTAPVARRFSELLADAADPKGDAHYFVYTRQYEPCARWLLDEFLPREFGFDAALLRRHYGDLLPSVSPERSAEAATRNLRYGGAGGVIVTNGAFAGLLVCLQTLCNAGDEVVYLTPSWFFYREHILECGAVPVPVPLTADDFDLPLDAIAAAIGPRTKAIIVNSPHNPSGRVFSRSSLERLAELLAPRGVWAIHDAAYQQVRFDDQVPASLPLFYPRSLLVYTWGKILLAPSQRIGFVVASPLLDQQEKDAVIPALSLVTTMHFSHANKLMQKAIPDLSAHCKIDLLDLRRKRDLLCSALVRIGYRLFCPQSTFYILVAHPDAPVARPVVDLLAAHHVYVLDGSYCEIASHFRISITATEDMCRAAVPIFEAVYLQIALKQY